MMATITQVEHQNVLNSKEASQKDDISSNHGDMSPYFDDKNKEAFSFPNVHDSELNKQKKEDNNPVPTNDSPKKQPEKRRTIK